MQNIPAAIELANGDSISVYRRWNGQPYIFLFPFLRTNVDFVDGEPYVIVYRGLRGRLNPQQPSGTHEDYIYVEATGLDPVPHRYHGDMMFTTLDINVAISYLRRAITFHTPRRLTVIRVRLPLRKAYIAKRPSNEWGVRDQFYKALESRNFMWFRWRSPQRRRERELIWNLSEIGGNLADPRYQLSLIEAEVRPDPVTGEFTSFTNWDAAHDEILAKARSVEWRCLSTFCSSDVRDAGPSQGGEFPN